MYKKKTSKKPKKKSSKSGRAPEKTGTHPRRVAAILEKLNAAYPAAECELHHENPFQLLVSTILSAQCTDERVNKVTPGLFAKYPTPQDLGALPPEALQ